MIRKCISDRTGFGIIAKIKDDFSEVGVYVEVLGVTKEYATGEMDIIVKGIWRFKRVNLEMHPDGYYVSEIKKYDDVLPQFDPDLYDELKTKVKEILKQVNFDLNPSFWDKLERSVTKSFKIAEKSGLTLIQQQELLSINEENKRLLYLIDHFDKLAEKLEKNTLIKQIILGDGYLN